MLQAVLLFLLRIFLGFLDEIFAPFTNTFEIMLTFKKISVLSYEEKNVSFIDVVHSKMLNHKYLPPSICIPIPFSLFSDHDL